MPAMTAAMPVPKSGYIAKTWGAGGVCRAYNIKYFILSIGHNSWSFILLIFFATLIYLFFFSHFASSLIRLLLQGVFPGATPD